MISDLKSTLLVSYVKKILHSFLWSITSFYCLISVNVSLVVTWGRCHDLQGRRLCYRDHRPFRIYRGARVKLGIRCIVVQLVSKFDPYLSHNSPHSTVCACALVFAIRSISKHTHPLLPPRSLIVHLTSRFEATKLLKTQNTDNIKLTSLHDMH